MVIETRREQLQRLFPDVPRYRLDQLTGALFVPTATGWDSVSNLPKDMRAVLVREMPWMSVRALHVHTSAAKDTYKAILESVDHKQFESVLMANKRGQWTICVSSQIGCAMRCTFCATGTMGLKRSLTADEIADQYRFWRYFLREQNLSAERISNIVFMGMGEPLANYENVKTAIHTWLAHTDLGPTKITVSSVGVVSQLEKLLTDPTWPDVRIAISLHSANQKKREEIVPTTVPEFLNTLADWSHRYAKLRGNRTHHITYEYTLISKVNDTPELALELARYIKKTAYSKVNVIPYNPVTGKLFERSDRTRILAFKEVLRKHGIDVTERKTMGDDIAAACGQLVVSGLALPAVSEVERLTADKTESPSDTTTESV